jgi:regulatory protein
VDTTILIEKIIRSRIPGNCVLILSNGEKVFSPIDAVMQNGLNKGSEINSETIALLKKSSLLIKLKGYSMKIASGFVRSEKQIYDKLRQKGYERDEVDEAIYWLKEMRLIDDAKFCENYVRYSVSKSWGRNKTFAELRKRKVDIEIASNILDEVYGVTDQDHLAMETAKKKLKLIQRKSMDKQKDAMFRHLIAKGFEYDIIKRIINEIFC